MPRAGSNIEEISVIFQHQTDRAVCIWKPDDDSNYGGDDIWLPLSQVTIDPEEPARGEKITLAGPHWLLVDKGLL